MQYGPVAPSLSKFKSLIPHLFAKYGKEMEALRIKIIIAPTKEEPFARTSLVTRARAGSAPIIP